MVQILSVILGAFFNRLRGGMFDPQNKYPDIVWRLPNALAFGGLIAFILHSWLVLPTAAIGMFVGSMFGWPMLNLLQEHLQMGKNLVLAAGRGLVWTGFIAVSIYYFDHRVLYFIPVGILFGVPYYLLSFINSDKARAWGEYTWGAILWGAISLTL